MNLDRRIITESLLQAIKNKNLEYITLGNRVEPYILKESDLEYLKHIKNIWVYEVEPKLKDSIPKYLKYQPFTYLVGSYDFSSLNDSECLIFTSSLTDEEIGNFKYIGSQVKQIKIKYNDYSNILRVIPKLPNIDILIDVEEKEKFPLKQFGQFENVSVQTNNRYYPIKYYIEQEEKLENMVKDIKNSNLSQLERFLAVYDIVKKFKKYQESPNEKSESRDLYDILSNDYIVCVGFANLLEDLLNKVGIRTVSLYTDVILPGDDLNKYFASHARVLLYLDDPKYNIKGYFISDPTWDNKLEENFYNYALFTPHERENDHLITYSSDDVYGSDSFEELQKRFKSRSYAVQKFISNTKRLDEKFYQQLVDRYKINEYLNETQVNSLINDKDIFQYIKENTMDYINGSTIIDATMEVYKFRNSNYTIEEYMNYKSKLLKSNFKRQEKFFPKIERYNDETYDVVSNKRNKFSR